MFGATLPQLCAPSADDFPSGATGSLRVLWERSISELKRPASMGGCGNDISKVLAYLYRRFGWEAGKVGLSLKRHKRVWGTFRDATGYHCNAHANNLNAIHKH